MTSAHQGQATESRILHWNIHSWCDVTGTSNLEAVAELVRATDPHVVSLVEVDQAWGSPSALDELAARSGYASIYVPTFEFGRDGPAGGFGNALLTKLPILAVRQRQLVWPPRRYDGSEPSEPRSVVFAELQFAIGRVWIGSTHLPRSEADTRMDALNQLITITQNLADPWLLLGDFNMPASSWLGEYPSLRTYPSPVESTYPTDEPIEPIDYCVASQALPVQAEVLTTTSSDHLPILVRCQGETL